MEMEWKAVSKKNSEVKTAINAPFSRAAEIVNARCTRVPASVAPVTAPYFQCRRKRVVSHVIDALDYSVVTESETSWREEVVKRRGIIRHFFLSRTSDNPGIVRNNGRGRDGQKEKGEK